MTREEFIFWFEERFALTKNDIYELGQLYDEMIKPHWISVEDELPPRWETNHNVSVPVITFGTLGESSIPFVEIQRYDFGKSKWQYGDATHWMPFQFPEKGGEE